MKRNEYKGFVRNTIGNDPHKSNPTPLSNWPTHIMRPLMCASVRHCMSSNLRWQNVAQTSSKGSPLCYTDGLQLSVTAADNNTALTERHFFHITSPTEQCPGTHPTRSCSGHMTKSQPEHSTDISLTPQTARLWMKALGDASASGGPDLALWAVGTTTPDGRRRCF